MYQKTIQPKRKGLLRKFFKKLSDSLLKFNLTEDYLLLLPLSPSSSSSSSPWPLSLIVYFNFEISNFFSSLHFFFLTLPILSALHSSRSRVHPFTPKFLILPLSPNPNSAKHFFIVISGFLTSNFPLLILVWLLEFLSLMASFFRIFFCCFGANGAAQRQAVFQVPESQGVLPFRSMFFSAFDSSHPWTWFFFFFFVIYSQKRKGFEEEEWFQKLESDLRKSKLGKFLKNCIFLVYLLIYFGFSCLWKKDWMMLYCEATEDMIENLKNENNRLRAQMYVL